MCFHFVFLLALYLMHNAIIAMGTTTAIGSSTKLVNCVSWMVRFIAGEAAFCNRVCQFLGAPMYTEAVRLPKL